MDGKRSDSPSKRIVPVPVVVCILVILWTINPQLIRATPELAVWPFETVNVSEADAREYVDGLIYHLERKHVFRIVYVGERVLRFVPEISLTGALSKENESYSVSIRVDHNYSGETKNSIFKSYSALGELFADSKRLADEIVLHHNISEQSLSAEDIFPDEKFEFQGSIYDYVPQFNYVFQGSIYEHRFSDYMDLVEKIEAQPDISEELEKAIKAYRRKGWSHGFGKMFEIIGTVAGGAALIGFGALGAIGESGSDADIDGEGLGKVLLVLGGLGVGGAGFYFLGIALTDPIPSKVVEIYNRQVAE